MKRVIHRVVLTRPAGPYEGGRTLAQRLTAQGYEVLEFPLLRCVPVALSAHDREQLEAACARLRGVWLAFLSPTAVAVWRELVEPGSILAEATSRIAIAVQGVGTAQALRELFCRQPDFVPSVFVAEEFAKELAGRLSRGETVIVPQSADGRDVFAPTLTELGHRAFAVATYRLEPEPASAQLLERYRVFVDSSTAVVFMSPSAVRAAAAVLGASLGTNKVLSIGPITSQAIRTAGFPLWREAREHSEDGVVASLQEG